jgi:hypothetical protein
MDIMESAIFYTRKRHKKIVNSWNGFKDDKAS